MLVWPKKAEHYKIKKILSYIRMGKEILMFEDIEIERNKVYHHKTPIFWGNVDIEKVFVSNTISFSEKNYKYFIGYLHNDNKVKPLHIMLPKAFWLCKKLSWTNKMDLSFWLKMITY